MLRFESLWRSATIAPLFQRSRSPWEGIGVLRLRRDPRKKVRRRFLTFSDRLIVRTLTVNVALLAPAYLRARPRVRTPDRSQVAGSLDVAVGDPRSVLLLGDFTPKRGGARTERKRDGHTSVHCDFPAAGTYDVRLDANRQRYGTFAYAGAVEVNARP